MLHSLNTNSENNTEMSVLERQRFRLKWQQEHLIRHQPITFFGENVQSDCAFLGFNGDQGIGELLVGGAMKPDPDIGTGSSDGYRSVSSYVDGPELEIGSHAIPRTVSCPPNMAAAAANIAQEPALSSAAASAARESSNSKKRKADKIQNLNKVIEAEKSEEKKMKGCKEEEYNKITEQNSSSKSTTTTVANNKNIKGQSANTKESSKTSEDPKPDYIHVRARRGQATDSHSLAERVRREKISEKMKFLQDLVPGCNKITGKAGMLDEIINYVQSLQRQVEFLAMKLATINPIPDLDVDNFLIKEMYPACTSGVPTVGTSSDVASFQLNTLGHGFPNSNLEMAENHLDVTLRRTTSAPVSIHHTFVDSSGNLNPIQHVTWEDELQNLYSMGYQQEESMPFTSQPFTGLLETGHVKMEM